MQIRVMQFFTFRPREAPTRLVNLAANSQDKFLSRLAMEILAQIDPGRLVALGQRDERARRALVDASLGDGTLFFETSFYSPRDLTFHSYAKPISPGRAPEDSAQAEA